MVQQPQVLGRVVQRTQGEVAVDADAPVAQMDQTKDVGSNPYSPKSTAARLP